MKKTIFITGATGNVGAKLVAQILQNDLNAHLVLLIRSQSTVEGEQRVMEAVQMVSPEIDYSQARRRIEVVCGDVSMDKLGFSDWEYSKFAEEVTHIIHSAATTQFNLPLECAHQVNVVGTKNVMEFAKMAQHAGNLNKVAHISTAYVCGNLEGTIYENNTAKGDGFSNSYEHTKWVAEQLVRDMMGQLPVMIFRPSIVVGDSRTGRTIKFNVLYTPLYYMWRGYVKALPCAPDAPVDVVSADFVAESITHIFLTSEQAVGKTFHIVAGSGKAASIEEIAEHAINYFNSKGTGAHFEPVRFIPPMMQTTSPMNQAGEMKRALSLVKMFEPYMYQKRTFDCSNTMEALNGSLITLLKLTDYLDVILDYSIATDWGRRMRKAA